MKFKSRMLETFSMKNLAFLGSTLTKLAKNCVLKLNQSEMSFLVTEENCIPRQILVWCIINSRQFFNEYVVEGMSSSNEIYLEFPTDMLSTSLNGLKVTNNNTRSVKIKLTDKFSPCLTVEIELISETGMTRTCVHDIPVKVLPRSLWGEYKDPPLHDSHIKFDIKNLKLMRNVVERLKKICTYVTISPSHEGSLTITASTQSVNVNTIFKSVTVMETSDTEDCNVRVDVKKLCTLLCCEVLNPKKVTCSISSKQLVHFLLLCDLFQITFISSFYEDANFNINEKIKEEIANLHIKSSNVI